MQKTYVLDTNVLIQSPEALEAFEDNHIVLPLAVLEELDGLKNAEGEKGRSARQVIRFLEERNAGRELRWQVRIGIHSGRVVGGVVGIKKYIYDVFGDTINTACRMEQNSEPMKINISEAARAEIGEHYALFERGELNVKGKGGMKMYFVTGPRRKEMEE